ncbi:hypothetical protein RHOSPDRAFT_26995 [Rhodotorula sp. JG-1b]|nr:hypothetical protein RHOSPDRAFT_26995 [Rhodotorula sp. JG-1b]
MYSRVKMPQAPSTSGDLQMLPRESFRASGRFRGLSEASDPMLACESWPSPIIEVTTPLLPVKHRLERGRQKRGSPQARSGMVTTTSLSKTLRDLAQPVLVNKPGERPSISPLLDRVCLALDSPADLAPLNPSPSGIVDALIELASTFRSAIDHGGQQVASLQQCLAALDHLVAPKLPLAQRERWTSTVDGDEADQAWRPAALQLHNTYVTEISRAEQLFVKHSTAASFDDSEWDGVAWLGTADFAREVTRAVRWSCGMKGSNRPPIQLEPTTVAERMQEVLDRARGERKSWGLTRLRAASGGRRRPRARKARAGEIDYVEADPSVPRKKRSETKVREDAADDAADGRQDSAHQQQDNDAPAADADADADDDADADADDDDDADADDGADAAEDADARSSQLDDKPKEEDKENHRNPTAGERVRPSRLAGDFARHFGLRPIKARQFAALGPDCDNSDGAYDFEWPETLHLPSLEFKVSELYDTLPKLPSLIALIGYMLFDLQFARKRILALEERLEAAGGQVPRFDTSGVEIVDFTEDAVAARVNVTGQPGRIHRVDFLEVLQPKEPAQPARREPLAAGKWQ